MKFTQYAEKLETIKHLAAHKSTGTPDSLSKKLNVSSRTIERMVQQLRDQGCPIVYNRYRATYEIRESSW